MRRMIVMAALLLPFFATGQAQADDPFAGGGDALAVKDSDGSSSLRAKLKLKKMLPDMVMVQVKGINDAKFPHCVLVGKVLKAAKAKDKHFKLLARGKTYRFAPVLKKKGRGIDLKHKMTQNNLGACYYPKKSKLIIRVSGVDKKQKAFKASEIYLK
ncbi:MAG: hypothetical protein JRH20_27170 [Deltaproteobacteria bacterium]|nr:hypothetical protein [Deltaproteobacteria bacterium]